MQANSYISIQQCSEKESRKILLTISAIIGLGIISVYLSPFETFLGMIGIRTANGCPLLTLSGIPCPFCGMGRVFSCITDLYIGRTFYYNPLGLMFYVFTGLGFGVAAFLAFRKRKIIIKNKLIWIPVGFVALMWIANILWGHHY